MSKCSPRAQKYVPKCTFFQKVSQSAPLAPQAWTGAPTSYQNEVHGCQNTGPGSSRWRPRVSKCSPRCSKIRSQNHTQEKNLIAQNLGLTPLSASPYIGPTLNRRIMVPLGAVAEPNIVDFLQGSAAVLRTSIYICSIYIHAYMYMFYIHMSV